MQPEIVMPGLQGRLAEEAPRPLSKELTETLLLLSIAMLTMGGYVGIFLALVGVSR